MEESSGESTQRALEWMGVAAGDAVLIDLPRERVATFTFCAHVRNTRTGEEWVEVIGGRAGESRWRSFRPELVHPVWARRGNRFVGPSLVAAPLLPLVQRRDVSAR